MFWRIKSQVAFQNAQRRDTTQSQITTYLVGKATTEQVIFPLDNSDRAGFWLTVIVNFVSQVDADQVWADIQSALSAGFIKNGFAGYAQFNDDGTSTLLGRVDLG